MLLWGGAGAGVLASFVLGLVLLLPDVVALLVKQQFEAFGYKHVNVVVDYPGLRRTVVPLLSLQKDVGGQTARLTIRGLTLDYRLSRLLKGFLHEARIEALHLDLTEGSTGRPSQRRDEQSLATVAAALDAVSAFLLDPPVGRLAVTNATIVREQAAGPFRQVTVSGALRHENRTLNGSVAFQGMEGAPYALHLTMTPPDRVEVRLHEERGREESLLAAESVVRVSGQGLRWHGSLKANLKRSIPFLALLMPLGSDLERADGVVELEWDGSTQRMGSFDRLLRDPSTRLHGVFQASAELPALGKLGEAIAMTLSGEVEAHATDVALTLFPSSSVKGLFRVPEHLGIPSRVKEPIRLQVQDDVKAWLDHDALQWKLEGPLRIHYGAEPSPMEFDAVVTNASGPFREPLATEVEAHGHYRGAWPLLETPLLRAEDLRWNVTGKLAFHKRGIHAEVEQGSWITTGPLRLEPGTANRAELHVSHTFPVSLAWPRKQWTIGPTTLRIALPRLHWNGRTFATKRVAVHLQEAGGTGYEWRARGRTILRGLSSAPAGVVPAGTNLAIGFDATSARVKAGIVAETADRFVRVTGLVTHDVTTHHGALRATVAPRSFSPSGKTLSQWITPWNYPFDLTEGRLGLSAAVAWGVDNEQTSGGLAFKGGEVTITAEDLDGSYENVLLEDVRTTIQMRATSLDDWTMVGPARVTMGRVDAGIEIDDLAMTLRLGRLGLGMGRPVVDLTNVSGHMLGGLVSSARIYVSPARPQSRLTLELDGLQLDRLLQLEQQEGLTGTGVLDGSIPITLTGKTITIRDGRIAVRPPGGVIRFQPLEETRRMLIEAKPEMELVLRALENFRYDTLRAGVNYQEDGTLVLETRLEGRNPDMDASPPVHFNLNVEENIPALLQSVQVVKGLETQLEHAFRNSSF